MAFCLTAAKWLVNVSVSEDDVPCLAHIVQYSQAQRRYSCRCVHLHSNLFSPRTHLIQFDSATMNIFVASSVFFSVLLHSALLRLFVYSVRKRWRERGEKDRQWGHPQQISTNDVSCRGAVSMPRLWAWWIEQCQLRQEYEVVNNGLRLSACSPLCWLAASCPTVIVVFKVTKRKICLC